MDRTIVDNTGRARVDWLVDPRTTIFGVVIADVTLDDAAQYLGALLQQRGAYTRAVYFVNAHGLNLAWESAEYRAMLNSADIVYGDGAGVRLAARLKRVRLKDNVNGTDLVPELMRREAGKGYRYYLLGGRPEAVHRYAEGARTQFPGWDLCGCHHGYLQPDEEDEVVEEINRADANLLLVGMGNPIQEQWIHRHRTELRVPVTIAVGGLFSYWASELDRAPAWMRRHGIEWLHILRRQPSKARRYLLGNPLFVSRILRERFRHALGY